MSVPFRPHDDEPTELVDADLPRVDLVKGPAHGLAFLVAKSSQKGPKMAGKSDLSKLAVPDLKRIAMTGSPSERTAALAELGLRLITGEADPVDGASSATAPPAAPDDPEVALAKAAAAIRPMFDRPTGRAGDRAETEILRQTLAANRSPLLPSALKPGRDDAAMNAALTAMRRTQTAATAARRIATHRGGRGR